MWAEYRRLRNCITNKINLAKNEYLRAQLNDNAGNSGAIWSVLKSISKNNKRNKICLEVNQDIISDADDVAEHLNNVFVNSVKKLAQKSNSEYDQNAGNDTGITSEKNNSEKPTCENNTFEMPVITQKFVLSQINKI